MKIVETCKGCKYKKRCNGKVSKNSKVCREMRKGIKVEKTYSSFLKKFRGLDKFEIFNKYLSSKEKQK